MENEYAANLIYGDENLNKHHRRLAILEKYPYITKDDAMRIRNFDDLAHHGMAIELERARQMFRDLDYRSLFEWTEQYESEFEEMFKLTWWHKEFHLLRGVALADYKDERENAKEHLDRANGIMLGGQPDVYTQASIFKGYGAYFNHLNDLPKAEAYYRKSLELAQTEDNEACKKVYIESLACLIYIYAATGRYGEAVDTCHKVLQYSADNDMKGYRTDRAYLGLLHVASFQKNVEDCELYFWKTCEVIKKYNLKGLKHHLRALDLEIRLHKCGIFEHEGKALLLYDMEDIDDIYYGHYMLQPEIRKKLSQLDG